MPTREPQGLGARVNASTEELEVMHPAAKLIVMAAKSQETGLGIQWGSNPQKNKTIPKF